MKRSGQSLVKTQTKRARTEEQKDVDEKKYIEITTKGEKIMPTNIKKYTGSVKFRKGTQNWYTAFHSKNSKHIRSQTYQSREQAEDRLKEVNRIENLPVRNIVYIYEGQYYCILTQNQLMKFGKENMDIVEKHSWKANYKRPTNTFYANTTVRQEEEEEEEEEGAMYKKVKRKNIYFHQMVSPSTSKETSTDHVNRDTLDNNPSNLRSVSKTIQRINQSISMCNTSGVVGVSYDRHGEGWVAHWTETQSRKKRFFSDSTHGAEAFTKAVAYRKKKERTVAEYRLALFNQSV